MKHKPSGDALDRALTNLYQADVPAGFQASWRDAVKREEPSTMKPTPRLAWLRRAALPIAAATVLIAGTAITGVIAPKTKEVDPAPASGYVQTAANADYSMKSMDMAEESNYDMDSIISVPAAAPTTTTLASTASRGMNSAENETFSGGEAQDSRKIVRTVSLTIATAVFDQDYNTVLALAEEAGGYASSINMYELQADRRMASFELRIPEEALDSFVGSINTIGRVTDRYETTTDLTTQYSDTALRLQTQQDKLARLQELMGKAETVSDLLEIETAIADTQYEIDSLQSSLLSIDRRVSYTTVSVYLQEQTAGDSAAAEDLTIGERLVSGLKASLQWLGGFFENMLVFLTAAAPVLLALILIYIVYRVVRKRRKHNQQSQ